MGYIGIYCISRGYNMDYMGHVGICSTFYMGCIGMYSIIRGYSTGSN